MLPLFACALAVDSTALLPQTMFDADSRVGVLKTFSTPLGDIDAQVLGAWPQLPAALLIHGATGDADHLAEWDDTATALASAGYSVLLPNFFSLSGGQLPDDDGMEQVLDALLPVGSMLLGKSLGGARAGTYAASHTGNLSKLVLDAPALMGEDEITPIASALVDLPLLLLWCEDDPTVPFSNADNWLAAAPDATLFTNATGGHWVVDEFVPVVVEFATGGTSTRAAARRQRRRDA